MRQVLSKMSRYLGLEAAVTIAYESTMSADDQLRAVVWK
jgi:hypothetical protein